MIGIAPFPVAELPRLQDLALIRHTVAHHAALVRSIDAPRFQHWDIQANAIINPPVEFVREVLIFLYRTGQRFETTLADHLFGKVLAGQPPNWHEAPSELVLTLIETFNWFGKLITDNSAPLLLGTPGCEQEERARRIDMRDRLNQQCIEALREKHAI